MFIQVEFATAIVALCALVAVNGLPVSDTASFDAKSKLSTQLLGQVSNLLSQEAFDYKSKLANARGEVKELQKRLTEASMKVAEAKQLFDTTKTKFDKFVGDHDECITDLQALDQAGLVSLKKFHKIKAHLNKLGSIIARPTSSLYKVQGNRPHDKLATKMSTFIDKLVSHIADQSRAKKSTCDTIHSAIEAEKGLRQQSIESTAALKTARDIFHELERKLMAQRKTIQLHEEQTMNKQLDVSTEKQRVASLQSEVAAMKKAFERTPNCATVALQIRSQSRRMEAAIDELVSNLQKSKELEMRKVAQTQHLAEQAKKNLDFRKSEMDQLKCVVNRLEREYRVLASEAKSDQKRCLVEKSVRDKEAAVLHMLIELIMKLEHSNGGAATSQIMSLLEAVRPIAGKALDMQLERIQSDKPSRISTVISMLQSVQAQLVASVSVCEQLKKRLAHKTGIAEQAFTKKNGEKDVVQDDVEKSEVSVKATQDALNQVKLANVKEGEIACQQAGLLQRVKPVLKSLEQASKRSC